MAEYWVNNQATAGADNGSSESDGFLTIGQALTTGLTAGDIVYIKGGSAYTETVYLSGVGAQSNVIRIIGYGSVTGDTGKFTIDGESIRTNCIYSPWDSSRYYFIRNMTVQNASDNGVANGKAVKYVNCDFINNANIGANAQDNVTYFRCTFSGNGNWGVHSDWYSENIECTVINNGAGGIYSVGGSLVLNCLIKDHVGSHAIYRSSHVINNTIINADVGYGTAIADISMTIYNNIIYSCTTGITLTSEGSMQSGSHNLLYSCSTLYSDYDQYFTTHDLTGTTDPGFTDIENGDYTLAPNSPAINSGKDLSTGSTGMDIGAYQSQDAGTRKIIIG